MTAEPGSAPSVMLVDDTADNLRLLDEVLTDRGYAVRCFPRGPLAIAAAREQPPDLFLLDVNMPGMSGYQVCARLKQDPALASIPVIFLSALDETRCKVEGFRCGGADYITKPFEIEEVLARVQTQLELRRLHRQLEQQNAQLDALVQMRTRQLAESQARLALLERAKSDFLQLISHELRTPLSGLVGIGELLLAAGPLNSEKLAYRPLFDESRDRLLRLMDDALLLAQLETDPARFAARTCSLEQVLVRAVDQVSEFARRRAVVLDTPGRVPGAIWGDLDLYVKAVHGLLETAIKFAADRTPLRLEVSGTPATHLLRITSQGRTVPAEALPRVFEVLAVSEPLFPGAELGLAAPLARRILVLFGGEVTLENVAGAGLRFEAKFVTQDPAVGGKHP